MGGADQGPFVSDLVEAAQEELSEGAGGLDLAEDRFNDLLSQAISAAPPGPPELGGHGGDPRSFAPASPPAGVAAPWRARPGAR